MRIQAMLPGWLRHYQRDWLSGDMIAGLIVTVMLIPQSLAYAMLAGVPPEIGLYASILPIVAYAWLGSSMTLAVGPVAVASLMTASALQPLATAGSPEYVALAMLLALLSVTSGLLHHQLLLAAVELVGLLCLPAGREVQIQADHRPPSGLALLEVARAALQRRNKAARE